MKIYISSLNEKIEVEDVYLPSDNVGLLDESDILLLLDREEEEGEEENWEGD